MADATNHSNSPEIAPEELFKIFRAYIEHEDTLINNRLSWLLAVQSLLFAGYGLGVQKLIEWGKVQPPIDLDSLKTFLSLLLILGLSTSLFVCHSIHGAIVSIENLKEDWEKYCENDCNVKERTKWLPTIIGGGSDNAWLTGIAAPYGIPLSFFSAWAFLSYHSNFRSLSIFSFFILVTILTIFTKEWRWHKKWWRRKRETNN